MNREAERRRARLPSADGERPQREGAELRRAVHQVLEVRRRERLRVRAGKQLRRHAPAGAGRRLEADVDGTLLETASPHQRGRHVDVCVRGVDRQVRAVRAIAEDAITDANVRRVLGNDPLMRCRVRHAQGGARRVRDADVEHVLRELMKRVASRRRAAHVQLERCRRQVGERELDLHPAMLGFREAQSIGNRRLSKRACGDRQ